jgi:CO/xanthine dehydrogenase Mo-binding subunit
VVINPEALKRTIEGGMLHSLSRTLHEEVKFDTEKVMSLDWNSHPSMTHTDTPERIDVVLVNGDPNPNRPDLPHYGAGRQYASRCSPQSPTPFLTQPAFGSVASRSEVNEC